MTSYSEKRMFTNQIPVRSLVQCLLVYYCQAPCLCHFRYTVSITIYRHYLQFRQLFAAYSLPSSRAFRLA